MEYRQLPHGKPNEKFSVLGLGLGGIGKTPACTAATAKAVAPLA